MSRVSIKKRILCLIYRQRLSTSLFLFRGITIKSPCHEINLALRLSNVQFSPYEEEKPRQPLCCRYLFDPWHFRYSDVFRFSRSWCEDHSRYFWLVVYHHRHFSYSQQLVIAGGLYHTAFQSQNPERILARARYCGGGINWHRTQF